MKKFYYVFIALTILGFSCTKSNNNSTAPTILSFHCIDGSGNATQGIAVTLYNNSTDWQNNANVAYSGTTDASGNVSFSGVNAQQYYFWCIDKSNCLLNWGAQKTNGSITANETNSLSVVETGYGNLSITNTSNGKNPYEIKLYGQVLVLSLPYGQTVSETLPLGNCTVEAIQLSGYVITPTDNTYTVMISQCQTATQNIP